MRAVLPFPLERSASGRFVFRCPRDIIEDRGEPALHSLHIHVLAPGIILDLIALHLCHTEIIAFRVTDIETRHRGAGPHGVAFGKLHAGIGGGIEQAEQGGLFRMIGLGRIAPAPGGCPYMAR